MLLAVADQPVAARLAVDVVVVGAADEAVVVLLAVDLVAALVVIRISVQFLAQIVGLLILRKTRPEMPRPFKMWLYPLPALVAIAGFTFVLFSRPNYQKELKYAAVLIVLGLIIYFVRAYFRKEFPFAHPTESAA